MFRKRTPIDITPLAYSRWLRAGRPPFDDFLAMPEDAQEALATIGDDHTQDVIEGLAAALLNPGALLAGADSDSDGLSTPPDSALALAQNVAEKLTMGGSGGARHVRPQSERPVGTLFGAKGEQIQ